MKSAYRVLSIVSLVVVFIVGYVGINAYADKLRITQYKYTITAQHLQMIYNQLRISSGQYGLPELVIVDNSEINAYTDGNAVYVNQGIINQFDNDDEAALVLGHEIAHILLGHTSLQMPVPQTIKEAQADKYGAFLAMKSGYDVCKGREIFDKIKKLFGDDPTNDHPALAYRVDQLNVGCDKN
jgi:Zn-dependent peptidase ImmA (M78 family)